MRNECQLTSKEISRVMTELGRRGGKIGGKRCMETMTPEQRSARASKAGKASAKAWRKHKVVQKALAAQRREGTGVVWKP